MCIVLAVYLATLQDRGLLIAFEAGQARHRLFGITPDRHMIWLDQLDQLERLYELCRRGALSESEFNMKKWDLLSS